MKPCLVFPFLSELSISYIYESVSKTFSVGRPLKKANKMGDKKIP
jgi:hypothetical protein